MQQEKKSAWRWTGREMYYSRVTNKDNKAAASRLILSGKKFPNAILDRRRQQQREGKEVGVTWTRTPLGVTGRLTAKPLPQRSFRDASAIADSRVHGPSAIDNTGSSRTN